jgi:hypothetical protein
MDEVVPVFFAQGAIEVPSGTWTVDSVHSVASFAVRHMMVGTFREFSEIDATLTDGKLIGKVKVMTDWAGLRCASPRSQPMVGQRPNFTALEAPPASHLVGSRSDGNATLTQTDVDAEVHPLGSARRPASAAQSRLPK